MLDIWLSHHPNLLTPYGETRFFHESLQHGDRLAQQWPQYLDALPTVPHVGHYFVYEKTPGYANNLVDARLMAQLLPSVKLLFLTRNPVDRAYSHFNMYTQLYVGAREVLRGQPVSFFVKHLETGQVRCVRDFTDPVGEPGVGGTFMEHETTQPGEWQYLSYPVDPEDFDAYVREKVEQPVDLHDHSRGNHVLSPGLYSRYLHEWLRHFAAEQLVIVPSELFYPPDKALRSLERLQRLLGLPLYDYGTLLMQQKDDSSRIEANTIETQLLQHYLNYRHARPMLNRTRELLDAYYCDSNRELSRMLGNRTLPTYSCAS